jgi:hypothetical protein
MKLPEHPLEVLARRVGQVFFRCAEGILHPEADLRR